MRKVITPVASFIILALSRVVHASESNWLVYVQADHPKETARMGTEGTLVTAGILVGILLIGILIGLLIRRRTDVRSQSA